MSKITVKHVVALTPDQAFAIASDVSSYPSFVPMVSSVSINGPVREEGGKRQFSATLHVAAGPGGNQAFTSEVLADAQEKRVVATSSDGPVKSLKAEWQFTPLAGSRCTATITIDYVFKNMLLQLAAGAVMDKAVNKILAAFEARGKALHPESAIPNI